METKNSWKTNTTFIHGGPKISQTKIIMEVNAEFPVKLTDTLRLYRGPKTLMERRISMKSGWPLHQLMPMYPKKCICTIQQPFLLRLVEELAFSWDFPAMVYLRKQFLFCIEVNCISSRLSLLNKILFYKIARSSVVNSRLKLAKSA